ncbi:thioredoxin family protein [Oceanicella actignis]|uniref:AhpC/TSA family protein n=1 Tax=Oceanicella actignis TaxID=1189325 RepID=A0A1M7SUL7_9RHOB|nr:thioredoxin family protein [Oceanicella actignis]TYO90647.1 AhpC/TSA family protein [Oceanicella actignis]SES71766.1 AhpC/TSA family protein [Oceanicella actignis]SHN62257.1 AhpC/TSA family protein [Oceanicella actignis]
MVALNTPVCDFGRPAPDFSLPDTEGRIVSLADIRGPRGTLVMFICNHCPYVKSIAHKLVRDARDLAELGVSTVAICSNDAETYPEDSFEKMGEFARAHGFPFPYLHDATQEVARAYGAVCTPDFFGYNADLELQYRGRLDAAGRERRDDLPRELYEAMKQVALTGRGPAEQTPSIGCSIKWRAA